MNQLLGGVIETILRCDTKVNIKDEMVVQSINRPSTKRANTVTKQLLCQRGREWQM